MRKLIQPDDPTQQIYTDEEIEEINDRIDDEAEERGREEYYERKYGQE